MSTPRKPTHAFAAFIWVAAFAIAAAQVVLWTQLLASAPKVITSSPAAFGTQIWDFLLRTVLLFAQLGAAAVLIELVDGLRWLATPEQDRVVLSDSYLVSRWRRSRVS
jgi:hypothetical protein